MYETLMEAAVEEENCRALAAGVLVGQRQTIDLDPLGHSARTVSAPMRKAGRTRSTARELMSSGKLTGE